MCWRDGGARLKRMSGVKSHAALLAVTTLRHRRLLSFLTAFFPLSLPCADQ